MASLTIAQYAGDFREAFFRLREGGPENYFAQRYSVDFVGTLTQHFEMVSVVVGITGERYEETLPNGVRVIGLGCQSAVPSALFTAAVERTQPTHLILTTPNVGTLDWADKASVRTLPLFADSFRVRGIRSWLSNRRLAKLLSRPSVRWIGNHGPGACLSLASIGVSADKIVPWDWPRDRRRLVSSPKIPPVEGTEVKLIFVGAVTEAKGVGDVIRALKWLGDGRFTLQVIGAGEVDQMRTLAEQLRVGDQIQFQGQVPNDEVRDLTRKADIAIIPSRHSYPEGLPLTIYEALEAETPIVASDHPMFAPVLTDGESAVIYSAARPYRLAQAIHRLASDHPLYERLSSASHVTLDKISPRVEWGELIEAWCNPDEGRTQLIEKNTLESVLR